MCPDAPEGFGQNINCVQDDPDSERTAEIRRCMRMRTSKTKPMIVPVTALMVMILVIMRGMVVPICMRMVMIGVVMAVCARMAVI